MNVIVNLTSKFKKIRLKNSQSILSAFATTMIVVSLAMISYVTYRVLTLDLSDIKIPTF